MSSYEKGKYVFRITGQGFGKLPSDKQTPYFFLEGIPTAKIEGDTQYAVEGEYKRQIKLWLTDKAVDGTVDRLRELGWPGGKFITLEPSNASAFSFVGMDIEAVNEPRSDGAGQMWDDFKLPYEGGEDSVSDSSIAAKMDAMFGKALKARPAKTEKPSPKAETVPPDSNPVDDDIPF